MVVGMFVGAAIGYAIANLANLGGPLLVAIPIITSCVGAGIVFVGLATIKRAFVDPPTDLKPTVVREFAPQIVGSQCET